MAQCSPTAGRSADTPLSEVVPKYRLTLDAAQLHVIAVDAMYNFIEKHGKDPEDYLGEGAYIRLGSGRAQCLVCKPCNPLIFTTVNSVRRHMVTTEAHWKWVYRSIAPRVPPEAVFYWHCPLKGCGITIHPSQEHYIIEHLNDGSHDPRYLESALTQNFLFCGRRYRIITDSDTQCPSEASSPSSGTPVPLTPESHLPLPVNPAPPLAAPHGGMQYSIVVDASQNDSPGFDYSPSVGYDIFSTSPPPQTPFAAPSSYGSPLANNETTSLCTTLTPPSIDAPQPWSLFQQELNCFPTHPARPKLDTPLPPIYSPEFLRCLEDPAIDNLEFLSLYTDLPEDYLVTVDFDNWFKELFPSN